MKFEPNCCPKCGGPAHAYVADATVRVLLDAPRDDRGDFQPDEDYEFGEERDLEIGSGVDADGKYLLSCKDCPHAWAAEDVDDPPAAWLDRERLEGDLAREVRKLGLDWPLPLEGRRQAAELLENAGKRELAYVVKWYYGTAPST